MAKAGFVSVPEPRACNKRVNEIVQAMKREPTPMFLMGLVSLGYQAKEDPAEMKRLCDDLNAAAELSNAINCR